MSGLRVIAGLAKGRKLQMVPGMGTRPIADRVKQALFNLLGETVVEATVLDLFAGTGGVGIEALSRGAKHATFVESDRQALKVIQANLNTTGFAAQANVIRADVFTYLSNDPRTPFDYIHIAPPNITTSGSKPSKPWMLAPLGSTLMVSLSSKLTPENTAPKPSNTSTLLKSASTATHCCAFMSGRENR